MNQKIAEITITLYQRGLLAKCEEMDMEALCTNGNELMDFLNEVQSVTDPDTVYKLTDKGKEVAKILDAHPDMTLDEASALVDRRKGDEK